MPNAIGPYLLHLLPAILPRKLIVPHNFGRFFRKKLQYHLWSLHNTPLLTNLLGLFSPYGKYILTGSADHKAIIYNTKDFEII